MKLTAINSGHAALTHLMEGNQSYLSASEGSGDISEAIRIRTCDEGQSPYAVLITCADSRVIPEKIFMTGIGEVFTIRVAGNVIGDYELGSIEYGVQDLGAKLVLVMGHSHCGAVDATIHNHGHDAILHITDEIKKAIGDETDNCLCEKLNILHSLKKIRESSVIQKLEKQTDFLVAGAYYHIRSGRVEILNEESE